MKKLILGLLTLGSVSTFAEITMNAEKLEALATISGGCFVREVLVWDKEVNNWGIKYSIFNHEGDRLSSYFNESKQAFLKSAEMRKNGECKLSY